MKIAKSKSLPTWSLILAVAVVASVLPTWPLAAQTASAPVSQDSAHSPGGSSQTLAAIAVTSYDNMISDLNFLGGLAGRPEVGQMVEGFVALFTQGKGLAGLDKTKPWGVLLQADGGQFKPIGCLPVNNAPELLSLLAAFQINVEDLGDGVMEVEIPEKPSVFIKSEGGWAYFSNEAKFLDDLPADPDRELATLVDEYDLAVRVDVQKVPAEYRHLAEAALRAGVQEGLQREEHEDDEAFEARKEWTEDTIGGAVRMIKEIDQLLLGWSLDSQQQRILIDCTTTFLPDSRMSRQLAEVAANSQTNYAGFYQPNAAVCLTFVQKADPELMQDDIREFKTLMKTARTQIAKGIDEEEDDLPADPQVRETLKQAMNGFLDVIESTIESGQLEGGAVLDIKPNAVTLVAGGHVADPEKVEESLRKLMEMTEGEPDFPTIHWNAVNHAGVDFHTAQFPIEADNEEAQQLFGPTLDLALGIGESSVYVAVGRENLAMAQRVIDASRAQPNKRVPASEILISLSQIVEMAVAFADDEESRAMTKLIAEMLRNEAQGRDHIRGVTQIIDNGQRVRFEVEEGVLRALGKVAEVAAQSAAAAGRP